MKWNIISSDVDAVCRHYRVGRLSGALLGACGASDEQIQQLLSDDISLSTSQADCIAAACRRIREAGANHEKVMIAGDYDCDGVCATAIMKDTLDRLGIVNGYYIPDRFKEGYGLAPKTVELAVQKGYSLLVTVDNGVKAHTALIRAKELGLETIVTDHHQIPCGDRRAISSRRVLRPSTAVLRRQSSRCCREGKWIMSLRAFRRFRVSTAWGG